MPDSRIVLPAPGVLDLIGIRADANVITIFAETSATTARCPVRNPIQQGPFPVEESTL
jgi:hypothetical protein